MTLAALPLRHQALFLLAICVAYANIWLGGFQFDDYNVIVNNPGVHTWQAWLDGLGHGIRPLLKLSYTLSWTAGWGIAGFHLFNLFIHLVTVLLVFELSRRFVGEYALLREKSLPVALFAALLFALHPANTEAVTYVSGRSSALMTLVYLGGLLFYEVGRAHNDKLLLYLGVPLCFAAALAVK